MSAATIEQLAAALSGRYRVERELEGGGMSRVFVAEETALGRRVVLKVLAPELAAVISRERFRREILLVARLQHAHIVPVLSAGDADGLLYFSMPFVEGESMRTRIETQGEFTIAEALRNLREIASALACAHAQGIVHRDIKPGNVLLSGGVAMVMDFGVAKALHESDQGLTPITTAGVTLGTALYMSPEQAADDPALDHRSDIYSFGVLAYEMLTGQPPFVGRSPRVILAAHASEAPTPISQRRPATPPALSRLIIRCLEKRPADRPQSADDLVRALDALTLSGVSTLDDGADADAAPRRAAVAARTGRPLSALLVLLAAGFLVFTVWPRIRGSGERDDPVAPGTSVSTSAIAVLPFISADTADAYLADGLTDELPGKLKKVLGLRVFGGRSVYAYRNTTASVADIGRALNVGALLEGTVRRAGGRLKITAHATNATDGSLIWSESYDVLASDVFKVQTDIASAIANALRLALTPLANADGAPRAPDPRAHDLYLQGRYALYKFTSSSIQEALAHFGRAIAIDPAYAEALAGIAGVWFYLAPDWESPEVAYPRARSAAQRAMAADSLLAESRVVWAASLLYNDWDLAGAEREARRAVVLDSLSADAHNLLGIILRARGRYEESRERTRRASELDPLIPQYLVNEAEAYQLEGRHIEALAVLQRATQVDSTYAFAHVRSAVSLMATGRYAGALQAAERGRAMRDRSRFAIAEILARSGRTAEAKVTLAELQSDGARRYVAADGIARIQLALGDKAGALASLERAFSEHSSGILWLASREFDPVRRDPRFVALTRGVRPRR